MNEKTIATVALRTRVSVTLQEMLQEAARWVETAAVQGANLAVLPETINLLHRKDHSLPLDEFALEDWQHETALLCETAARCGISLVLPLLVRSHNSSCPTVSTFFPRWHCAWLLSKACPCPWRTSRLASKREAPAPIAWEGLRIGGAICVDVYYPHAVFDPQMEAGADLFVIPSLTPAGVFAGLLGIALRRSICSRLFALESHPRPRRHGTGRRRLSIGDASFRLRLSGAAGHDQLRCGDFVRRLQPGKDARRAAALRPQGAHPFQSTQLPVHTGIAFGRSFRRRRYAAIRSCIATGLFRPVMTLRAVKRTLAKAGSENPRESE